ncbi:MAG TPA: NADH:flavin oxidoreductase [Kofleriaceae bacterium]|nr:NADH:flavin oxidoreductase [Kofleriaceae bacterium]
MGADVIFSPLALPNLAVKNRIFRSSISGRIDNYDGTGTRARINFEVKFARSGIGAIISSHVPISLRGRILPNYAFIDRDERIPFWRAVGEAVHAHDCKYILQLSHSGRQQDIAGIENLHHHRLSSSSKVEQFHGFHPDAMTRAEIAQVIDEFAAGARRTREAGLDGIELHAGNGYLINQFLSSAINNREDEYGGPLEHRARFLLEVIAAVRAAVGKDFFLGVKYSPVDYHDAVTFWEGSGNTLAEGVQVARWIEAAGADAIHVSSGSMFPHPRNPPGDFPLDVAARTYPILISEGTHTLRNYFLFRYKLLRPIARYLWHRAQPDRLEGINIEDSRAVKAAVSIPVLVTGGFQTASVVRQVLTDGTADGVTIARPLIANPDLLQQWAAGRDEPERPCTYCNKCLINVVEHPLGCYEESRYPDYDTMIREVMSIFEDEEGIPPPSHFGLPLPAPLPAPAPAPAPASSAQSAPPSPASSAAPSDADPDTAVDPDPSGIIPPSLRQQAAAPEPAAPQSSATGPHGSGPLVAAPRTPN